MTTYPIASSPSLVQQAESLAAQLEFTQSSLSEVGRLLHVLTCHRNPRDSKKFSDSSNTYSMNFK
ncbi:hypothetical protein [Nostoc sp.]|uniref:hypothetical protein n=1 Tax=Nostoc sp. TaxID=1180 RepID=UPI002FF94DC1